VHYLIRRGFFYAHRDLRTILDIAWIENELRKAGIWIDDLIVIARGNCEEYLNKSKSK